MADQKEDGPLGWLFQAFEQGIGSTALHVVDCIHQNDTRSGICGRQCKNTAERTNLINCNISGAFDIRRPVSPFHIPDRFQILGQPFEKDEIGVGVSLHQLADRVTSRNFQSIPRKSWVRGFAEQPLCKRHCSSCLANAFWPDKQPPVVHTSAAHRAQKIGHDAIVADQAAHNRSPSAASDSAVTSSGLPTADTRRMRSGDATAIAWKALATSR